MFITNKSGLTNNDICIIDKNNIITKKEDLTNLFNEHYITIVEKSTGVKPISLFEYKEVNFFIFLFERDVPMTPYHHLLSQHYNASWRGLFMYIAQPAPHTTFNT